MEQMLAREQVGLAGQAQLDAVDLGRCTIQFGRGRGSGSDADPERLSAGLFDAARQRQQNGPGVIPGPALSCSWPTVTVRGRSANPTRFALAVWLLRHQGSVEGSYRPKSMVFDRVAYGIGQNMSRVTLVRSA